MDIIPALKPIEHGIGGFNGYTQILIFICTSIEFTCKFKIRYNPLYPFDPRSINLSKIVKNSLALQIIFRKLNAPTRLNYLLTGYNRGTDSDRPALD